MRKFFIQLSLLSLFLSIFSTQKIEAQTFINPLPVPPLLLGNNGVFDLTADSSTYDFSPVATGSLHGLNIKTFCYNNAGYLGPTMVWQRGIQLQLNVTNHLNERITTHWHGLNLPAPTDGGPQEVIDKGSTWSPSFKAIDAVQTAWYHPHLMDSTVRQVAMGMAGMILMEDPNDPIKPLLPHDYGKNDFPIVIQDKTFDFTSTPPKINNAPTAQNGKTTLVNGVVYGFLPVPKEMVRLRLLNGSIIKSFHLSISPSADTSNTSYLPMYLVGTDGGYTAQPHQMDSLILAPGERMEMVVDFSTYNFGDTLYLRNLVKTLPSDVIGGKGNGGQAPINSYAHTPGSAFMAFVISDTVQPATPISSLPSTLVSYTVDTSNVFKHRNKELMKTSSTNPWAIDSTEMDMNYINDVIRVNTKEMWTIHNNTTVAHPFHIHKVQFQVTELRDSNSVIYYDDPNFPVNLRGYKDDVLIPAHSYLTFIANFDSFPSTLNDKNGFMYHCHILVHEDRAMMHQFVVVDSQTYHNYVSNYPIIIDELHIYPNPAEDILYLKGDANQGGMLHFRDVLGRELREEHIMPFYGRMEISVADLPRGVIFVEWVPESHSTHTHSHGARKIILK